jgi:hypothetical protein
MKINVSETVIQFQKKLSGLDMLVVEFTSLLNRLEIPYVLVSGYVAFLFGRSRMSEDVDCIVEKLDSSTFMKVWKEVSQSFDCLNTTEAQEAYEEYLGSGSSIRFSKKKTFIPNIEFKFPKVELDRWTLQERKTVVVNGHQLYISPLELQIPFKLYLGTEKDIEDAKYLYQVFQGNLDLALLQEFNRKLKTEELFQRYVE